MEFFKNLWSDVSGEKFGYVSNSLGRVSYLISIRMVF